MIKIPGLISSQNQAKVIQEAEECTQAKQSIKDVATQQESAETYQKNVAVRERAERQLQSEIALLGSSIDDLLGKELDYWKRKRSRAKRSLKSDEVQAADAQLRSLRKSIFEVEDSARDALDAGDLKGFDAKGFSRLEKAMQQAFGTTTNSDNEEGFPESRDEDVLDIPEFLRRPQSKSQDDDEDEEGEIRQRRQFRLF